MLSRNLQRKGQVGLPGNADFAADQPIDMGRKRGGGGYFERRVRAQGDGKEHLVFVAKIHQRAKRQAAGCGKLHGSGGDARWKRPLDGRRLPGVAGVDPIDVPALIQGEVQAYEVIASGLDRIVEGKQLDCEVLGPDGSRYGAGLGGRSAAFAAGTIAKPAERISRREFRNKARWRNLGIGRHSGPFLIL